MPKESPTQPEDGQYTPSPNLNSPCRRNSRDTPTRHPAFFPCFIVFSSSTNQNPLRAAGVAAQEEATLCRRISSDIIRLSSVEDEEVTKRPPLHPAIAMRQMRQTASGMAYCNFTFFHAPFSRSSHQFEHDDGFDDEDDFHTPSTSLSPPHSPARASRLHEGHGRRR